MSGARAIWPQPCYKTTRLPSSQGSPDLALTALPKRASPSMTLTPMTQLYSPFFPVTLSFPDRVSLYVVQAGLELLP